jgi:hypothetical protein
VIIPSPLVLFAPIDEKRHHPRRRCFGECLDIVRYHVAWDTVGGDAEFSVTVDSATATPLPAALPMFMGGAALIGLLARRRKQKRAA